MLEVRQTQHRSEVSPPPHSPDESAEDRGTKCSNPRRDSWLSRDGGCRIHVPGTGTGTLTEELNLGTGTNTTQSVFHGGMNSLTGRRQRGQGVARWEMSLRRIAGSVIDR